MMDLEGTQIESLFDKDYSLIDQKIDGKEVTTLGWACEYDKRGLLIKAVDPSGATWQFAYNGHGDLFLVENPLSDCTCYFYDQARRLSAKYEHVSQVKLNADRTGLESCYRQSHYRTLYFYNNLGRLSVLITGDCERTQFSYDENGVLCEVTWPSGYTIRRILDEKLRVTALSDTGGVLQEYAYDDLDRIVSVKTPSKVMQYSYDSAGRVQGVIDGNGNSTSFDYESFVITDAAGAEHFVK